MSETTHHDAALNDEGFHEIQISGKQLVFLFMLGATLAVVIFLCGVQVGRGVRNDRIAASDTADAGAAAAVPPSASTPSQAAASGGPPAAEPPAPAQEPDDELSYAKRLQANGPPAAEKLAPKPAEPAAPAASVATNPPPKQTAAPPPSASAGAATGRPGPWIVQATALQDRKAASAIAARLSGKGYPAFVLDPPPGAPVIYRVQVGGYPTRDKAEEAMRQLNRDEQFKAYVRAR